MRNYKPNRFIYDKIVLKKSINILLRQFTARLSALVLTYSKSTLFPSLRL